MRAFLDTNIIIDFYDKRPSFFDAAAQIIAMAYRKEVEIVVSPTSIVNAFYLLRKSYDVGELASAFLELSEMCTISDITHTMITDCLKRKNIKDFEDCVQIASAKEAKADIIITRDRAHFADCGIAVQTPTEFLMGIYGN